MQEQRRRKVRASLLEWCTEALQPVNQTPARHHRLIIEKLEKVARGEIDRLMIYCPPGAAKSTYASVLFPVWWFTQYPRSAMIAASHTIELAESFGRKVRNLVDANTDLLSYNLVQDNRAVGKWSTDMGGEYLAVGVGKAVAGRRADLLVIDDPVSSREDAESETQRDRTYNWYRGDLYDRLKPGARVILIQCMVGDTRVLMADGTEKNLRDIRTGDRIATYDDGILRTSTIEAWKSQGEDAVFEVQTQSGAKARANERHPFLVERDGQRLWVRLRDLRIGDQAVRVTATDPGIWPNIPGRGSAVAGKAARSQQSAKATACPTTTKRGGPLEFALRLATRSIAAKPICYIDTASPPQSTALSFESREACAPSANSLPRPMYEPIGLASFVSTTITSLARCEDFSATTATSPSAMARTKPLCSVPLNTSDFTLDRVTAIIEVGRAEVFDVQVARTQNFIADGFASHNTRWHEDDLGGRLIQDEENGGDRWHRIMLPALCEDEENDPLGRKIGDPLWPEWEDEAALQRKRRVVGEREWVAKYQQRPSPAGGAIFNPDEMPIIEAIPLQMLESPGVVQFSSYSRNLRSLGSPQAREVQPRRVRAWDLATTEKIGTRDPDWTVGLLMCRTLDNRYVVESVVRMRGGPQAVEATLVSTAAADEQRYGPGEVLQLLPQDPGQAGKSQVGYLTTALAGFRTARQTLSGDKAVRATAVASQVNVGNVSLIKANWNRDFCAELAAFPNGSHDDMIDALSMAFNRLVPPRMAPEEKRRPPVMASIYRR